MTWRALHNGRYCSVKNMTLENDDSESSKGLGRPKYEGHNVYWEDIHQFMGETKAFFKPNLSWREGGDFSGLCCALYYFLSRLLTCATQLVTLHIHCIQVCLHCFGRFEACAGWGWGSGGDNYNTLATPSRERWSVQISELSLELLCSHLSNSSPRFGNRYYENRNPEEEVPGKIFLQSFPYLLTSLSRASSLGGLCTSMVRTSPS